MAFIIPVAGCSINPATGQQQFAALMSPQQENKIGAAEHQKVIMMFGKPDLDDPVQHYVEQVGQRVARNTERPDVQYRFFVIDTPMVNAFALPGGYVYVSRGLLALANSESALAGVLGHEIGHITGRHAAERYSRGVVTSLGAMVLAAALDNSGATRAIGVGSDLFMKSYSREQESEADRLGIRYLARNGYDPYAMAHFLDNLADNTALEQRLAGKSGRSSGPDYFSTHPLTQDRVVQASALAGQYPKGGNIIVNRDGYLAALDGLVYGDSPRQGFVRGLDFYHTGMDFTFRVPPDFRMVNQPSQVVATAENGAVILFDAVGNPNGMDAVSYMTQLWMKKEAAGRVDRITINGMAAATTSFDGMVSGRPVSIRLVAVAWAPDKFFRFQIAIPNGAGPTLLDELKRTTYSLRRLSKAEKSRIKPWRVRIVTAQPGDNVAGLAGRQPFDTFQEERFRVLNGLKPGEGLVAGRQYKLVSAR